MDDPRIKYPVTYYVPPILDRAAIESLALGFAQQGRVVGFHGHPFGEQCSVESACWGSNQ